MPLNLSSLLLWIRKPRPREREKEEEGLLILFFVSSLGPCMVATRHPQRRAPLQSWSVLSLPLEGSWTAAPWTSTCASSQRSGGSPPSLSISSVSLVPSVLLLTHISARYRDGHSTVTTAALAPEEGFQAGFASLAGNSLSVCLLL